MSNIDKSIEYFNNLEETKRVKELEHYIDNNEQIKDLIDQIHHKQKQMINAREYDQINQYNIYKAELDELNEKLLDLPFVEEYTEALNLVGNKLIEYSQIVEELLDKAINK